MINEQVFLSKDGSTDLDLSKASNSRIPVFLMHGKHDLMVKPIDVSEVIEKL